MAESAAGTASVGPWRATGAALSANLVGIGLARFGYTPLIPALIAAGWFAPAAAVYLGAANLAGYLAGALGARALGRRLGAAGTLRGAMLLTAASLFACAFDFGFAWFFVWRFVSGCTGGVLMALAAPFVLASIPEARRGIAGGAVFTGVGIGIAASGTLVPLLMRWGLVETWLGLAVLALVLSVLNWGGWPQAAPPAAPSPAHRPAPAASRLLRALYLEYALNAVGLVPHMVFLVDFIARGLHRGLAAGGSFWVIFGVGAVVGPLIAGHIGDRIGFRLALRLSFLAQAAAVAAPLFTAATAWLAMSSFVVGAFVPGCVALALGRSRELAARDPAAQAAAWGYCTTAFAIGQAAAAYAFSYIFASTAGGYPVLFGLAAAALLAALAVDLGVGPTMPRQARSTRAA